MRRAAVAGVLAAVAACAATPRGARHAETPALPFIDDDYPRALAEARAKRLPLFVEAWAPW